MRHAMMRAGRRRRLVLPFLQPVHKYITSSRASFDSFAGNNNYQRLLVLWHIQRRGKLSGHFVVDKAIRLASDDEGLTRATHGKALHGLVHGPEFAEAECVHATSARLPRHGVAVAVRTRIAGATEQADHPNREDNKPQRQEAEDS
jgi:hypothetical protein